GKRTKLSANPNKGDEHVRPVTTPPSPARRQRPKGASLYTDRANARRFAEEHGAELRWVSTSRKWLVWRGTHWGFDDTADVQRRAKNTVDRMYASASAIRDPDERAKVVRYALASQRGARIASMIELAKSEAGIPITPDKLDSNPWLLNVENGTLDLRTGDLR